MLSANEIVAGLLETDEVDPDDIELSDLVAGVEQDRAQGKITMQAALTANRFYHRTQRYAGNRGPIEVRRTGKTKTWKKQPGEFKIPVKFGLRQSFYITPQNAEEWSTIPNPAEMLAQWKRRAEQTRLRAQQTDFIRRQQEPSKPDTQQGTLGIKPERDPNQPELFNESVSRLRKLGILGLQSA